MALQVNGKVRAQVQCRRGRHERRHRKADIRDGQPGRALSRARQVRKVIIVPGRIANIVVEADAGWF